jgi:hypothetical protein
VTSPDGRLRKGARLRNILHDRTGDTVFTPRVLTMDRDRELCWLGAVGFRGLHSDTLPQFRAMNDALKRRVEG